MAVLANPALKEFVSAIGGDGLLLAQVLIRRAGPDQGYELRQVADQVLAAESLRVVKPGDARTLAQFTATGAFRPLKSAPNLQTGWRIMASDDAELETALNQLYPGAIADWFAVKQGNAPVTHFREFTARQSGMYRITAMLDDAQAALVTRACCGKKFCLKRRLWTVPGLAPDDAAGKSLIPCLEPCAVFLEFARKAMRIEQAEKVEIHLSPEDVATLVASLEGALTRPEASAREGDVSAPANPRRVQLVLEKLQPFLKLAESGESD